MGIERKVVVGHWSDPVVQEKIASWQRVAVGVVAVSYTHLDVYKRQVQHRTDEQNCNGTRHGAF